MLRRWSGLSLRTGSAGGLFTINPDGSYSFDPNGEFDDLAVGETRDTTISYTIDDGEGGTDTATVTLTVTGVNDAPVPVDPNNPGTPPADPSNYIPGQSADDSNPVPPLDLTPYFGDPDSSDTLSLSVDPADLPPGLVFDPATGIISGTPDASASQGGPNSDGVYTIPVTVDDGHGGTFTTNVTYTISNPAPVAENDTFSVVEDTPAVLDVLANDTDPDGDVLSVSEINGQPIAPGGSVILPSGSVVSLNPDGTLDYDPAPDLNGPDSFDYTLADADGSTDTATVNLDIAPVNDVPVAAGALPDQNDQDGATVIPVSIAGDFTDIDGDTLSYTATGLPPGLSLDPQTGIISGTLDHGASDGGPYTVVITATDPDGASVTDSFVWTVGNVAPVIETPIPDQTGTDGTSVNLPVGSHLADPDGDTLVYTATGLPEGLVIDPASGRISGTLASDASVEGPYTIVVTATDASGDAVSDSFVLDVANPAPVMTDIPPQDDLTVGEAFTLDIGALVSDPDGDSLTFTATGLPEGLVIDPATGVISGTPTIPANFPYQVTVTVSDGQGGTSRQLVKLNVVGDPYVPEVGRTTILPLGKDVVGAGRSADGTTNGAGAPTVNEDSAADGAPFDLKHVFAGLEKGRTLRDILDSTDYVHRGGMAVASGIPGFAEGAGITVEGIAYENDILVSLSETISSLSDHTVSNWHVDMGGQTLPEWIDYRQGQDFIILNRPLAPESVTLHIQAILDNGRHVGGSFRIDLRTGEVELVGRAVAQTPTLSQQFAQVSREEQATGKALLATLNG